MVSGHGRTPDPFQTPACGAQRSTGRGTQGAGTHMRVLCQGLCLIGYSRFETGCAVLVFF